jgi:hypothetical protein
MGDFASKITQMVQEEADTAPLPGVEDLIKQTEEATKDHATPEVPGPKPLRKKPEKPEEPPETSEEGPQAATDEEPEAKESKAPEKGRKAPQKAKEAPPEPEEPAEASDDHLVTLEVKGEKIRKTVGELRASAQKLAAADKAMQQAMEAETEARGIKDQIAKEKETFEAIKKSLLGDPLDTYEKLLAGAIGSEQRAHDVTRQLVIDYLNRELELERMPPEQRALMSEKRRIELETKRLQEEKAAQERVQQASMGNLQQRAIAMCQQGMVAAGLPNREDVLQAVARTLHQAMSSGINLSPEKAAAIVKEQRKSQLQSYQQQGLPIGDLLAAFPEFESDIRRHAAKRAQHPATKASQAVSAAAESQTEEPTKTPRRDKVQSFGSKFEWRKALEDSL